MTIERSELTWGQDVLLSRKIAWFLRNEEGATTVEYAIMITLILLAIAQTVVVLGTTARNVFDSAAGALP